MSEILAYCGLNCSKCPAYVATQCNDEEGLQRVSEKWASELNLPISAKDCVCDGCLPTPEGRLGGYCNECPMRACNIRKNQAHCGVCQDFPCEIASRFMAQSQEAKENLEALRGR